MFVHMLQVMMNLHLDIKLFAEILAEVEAAAVRGPGLSRGCSLSTGVELLEAGEGDQGARGGLKTSADILTLKVGQNLLYFMWMWISN